jgi:sugar lactone lactonase YvrE
MTRQVIKPIALSALFCSFLYVLVIPVVVADELVAFDPGLDEFPESVSADVSGNVYVSLRGGTGEIRRIKPNGKMVPHFQLSPPPPAGSLGILGVLTDGPDQLFTAVASFHPDTHGVWLVRRNGKANRIEGSQNMIAPNDLVLDDDGNIYVTDLLLGAVWRISRTDNKGYSVELWAMDEKLKGNGSSEQGIPLGANGIAYHDGKIHVAVTERAHIISFDIVEDGSAGPAEIYAAHPGMYLIDGITVDSEGVLYGAVVALGGAALGAVMRIEQGQAPEIILGPANGLQFPTSVTFGSHPTDCNFLYIVNWDVIAPLLGVEPKPALHGFSLPYSGDAITCNPW